MNSSRPHLLYLFLRKPQVESTHFHFHLPSSADCLFQLFDVMTYLMTCLVSSTTREIVSATGEKGVDAKTLNGHNKSQKTDQNPVTSLRQRSCLWYRIGFWCDLILLGFVEVSSLPFQVYPSVFLDCFFSLSFDTFHPRCLRRSSL